MYSCVHYEPLLITSVKWLNRCNICWDAKPYRNLFACNSKMQGCGISNAKEGGGGGGGGGVSQGFYCLWYNHRNDSTTILHLETPFSLHDSVEDCDIFVANALVISQCCTLYLTTALVIPQCYGNSLANQIIYCSVITLCHQYFRTGIGTILMIWSKYSHHGRQYTRLV